MFNAGERRGMALSNAIGTPSAGRWSHPPRNPFIREQILGLAIIILWTEESTCTVFVCVRTCELWKDYWPALQCCLS
jgi:hypothetical protein